MEHNSVILSLGSNLGNPSGYLKEAVDHLKNLGEIKRISSEFASEAMGFEGPDFINIVVIIKTTYSPTNLLQELKSIEVNMGRAAKISEGYASRIIDIDIISFNNEVFETENLQIPHKEMEKRSFVLIPLKEVCPDWTHPITHKSVDEMLKQLAPCI